MLYSDEKKESKSFLVYSVAYGLNLLAVKGLINVDCHVNIFMSVTLKRRRQKKMQESIKCAHPKGLL